MAYSGERGVFVNKMPWGSPAFYAADSDGFEAQ
jgi:hypothetical protein